MARWPGSTNTLSTTDSETQLNPKTRRRAVDESIAVAIGRDHSRITSDFMVISPPCLPVDTRFMTEVMASLPQLMLPVMLVMMVVFGFCSWRHCQCRGPNDACTEQNVGQLLVHEMDRSSRWCRHHVPGAAFSVAPA